MEGEGGRRERREIVTFILSLAPSLSVCVDVLMCVGCASIRSPRHRSPIPIVPNYYYDII
jgi:hypothetical protein